MPVSLSRKARGELERIVGEHTGQSRWYRRARMILLAAAGTTTAAIARKLDTSRSRVHDWLTRYEQGGLAGLGDLSRSGRPQRISSLERHQVIAAACRRPVKLGVQRDVWSHESLARALVEQGLVTAISRAAVQRILDEARIKPHRVKMWCHSTDPDFQAKMRAIVELYLHPPDREPVLCVDEKTGMQALSRSRALQPACEGRSARFEFEYKRHGTRCLFACFNVGSGKVHGRCTTTRTRAEFLDFMDRVASVYRQRRVHIILDNLNTHLDTSRGAFISDWNRRHGERFRFHYTPTHGSWLNQIELWFAIVSRRILRYGNFASADALVEAIEVFIADWNESEAHPFRWTYAGNPLVP
jgi:transposase